MKIKSTVGIVTAIGLVAFWAACGGGSSSSSTSSGVTVSGLVDVPTTAASSISKGLTKAETYADSHATGGTVAVTTLGGTALDNATIDSNGAFSCDVDTGSLDSTLQVLIKATDANGKTVTSLADLTGKANGDALDAGTANSDTTLAVQQIYYQGDPNCTPDSPSACAAKFIDGTVNPLALFKVFKGEFELSDATVGEDNAANAYQVMRKAFRGALANGKPSFGDINAALQGGSVLSTWQGYDPALSGVNMTTMIGHIQNFIPAVGATFSDSATYSKYASAGAEGWAAAAQYFGKQTKDDLKNGIDNPDVFRGYMKQKATSFIAGDTTAFDAMKKEGAARAIGQMAGKCAATDMEGKYDALEKLMDAQKDKFDAAGFGDEVGNFGDSLCNVMKAAGSSTQLDMLKNDPGSFMGKIFDNPGAYIGTAGATTFGDQFTAYVQNPTAFMAGAGCSADTDCPAATPECSPMKYCMAACTSNCGFGTPCTASGICATGYCDTAMGVCKMPGEVTDAFVLRKGMGQACTANADCMSNTCTSGVCSFPSAGVATLNPVNNRWTLTSVSPAPENGQPFYGAINVANKLTINDTFYISVIEGSVPPIQVTWNNGSTCSMLFNNMTACSLCTITFPPSASPGGVGTQLTGTCPIYPANANATFIMVKSQ